ncbi:hypothetical protein MLD38_032849 [Melastoma candidum]|uniref:Uncharacterized protein n=1 Tax=Melastoma candidum TaxID=119954 RepID=A0ACB9M4V5_9MYRT|nr:hypothetical protein MLD38_032849 [Melastoma candidum]
MIQQTGVDPSTVKNHSRGRSSGLRILEKSVLLEPSKMEVPFARAYVVRGGARGHVASEERAIATNKITGWVVKFPVRGPVSKLLHVVLLPVHASDMNQVVTLKQMPPQRKVKAAK